MINPNKTPAERDIKEIRETVIKTTIGRRQKTFNIAGYEIRLTAQSGVYLSAGFGDDLGDSGYYAREIPNMVSESFLEIGTGSGIISISVAVVHPNIKIVATDINHDAVINAGINFFLNLPKYELEERINLRNGSMFEPIKEGEKFKFIFWNHPFHRGTDHETFTEMTGFDPQFHGFEEYIKNGHNFLEKDGKLLLGSGNFADLSDMRKILKKNNRQMNLLRWVHKPVKNLKGGEFNTYNIYEIRR